MSDVISALQSALTQTAQRIAGWLPHLLGAVLLVLIGWLVARLLSAGSGRLLDRLLERLARRTPSLEEALRETETPRLASATARAVIFWVVLLFFLVAAVEALGLPTATGLLGAVAAYLPTVLAAVLVIFIGLLVGGVVRRTTASAAAAAGLRYADQLGRLTQAAVVLVAGVVAVDQLGIDSTFLVVTIAIVIAMGLGGIALAFGLGAGGAVSNIIAGHYVAQTYRPGQTVRIGDVEGRITQIMGTVVVLDVPQGRLYLPARRFTEEPAVVLTPGG